MRAAYLDELAIAVDVVLVTDADQAAAIGAIACPDDVNIGWVYDVVSGEWSIPSGSPLEAETGAPASPPNSVHAALSAAAVTPGEVVVGVKTISSVDGPDYDVYATVPVPIPGVNLLSAGSSALQRAVLELDQYRQSSYGNAGLAAWTDGTKWRVAGVFTATGGLAYGVNVVPTVPASATAYTGVQSQPQLGAGVALTTMTHFLAGQPALSGATIGTQRGFHAAVSLAGASSNIGFYADVSSAPGNWNFYGNSGAPNYFGGAVTAAGRLYAAAGLTVTAASEVPIGGVSAPLQVHAAGASGLGLSRWTLDPSGPVVRLAKSRGTTVGGTATAVAAGDTLAQISAHAADGSDLASEAARISVQATAAPTTGSAPGRIVLATTPVGGSTPVERLRIDDAGNIQMGGSTTVISAERHPILRSYTVATLPTASPAAQLIYVSNGASSKRLAVSDGSAWRWPDGDVVS